MRPLHILHVLGSAQREGTSVAKIVRSLAQRLDRQHYVLEALFLSSPGPLIEELQLAGVPSRHLSWPHGARSLTGAVAFWRYLKTHSPDLVHQHFGGRSITWTTRRLAGIPVVLH